MNEDDEVGEPAVTDIPAGPRSPTDEPGDTGEFKLSLEPDFCCGGGHCGPLPGYTFVCPNCGKDTACRLGDYLEVGQVLTCYMCKREMKAVSQLGEYDYSFIYVS